MLILARKVEERIRIETAIGAVEILVTKLDDGRVWLGFDAPREFRIMRNELGEWKDREVTE